MTKLTSQEWQQRKQLNKENRRKLRRGFIKKTHLLGNPYVKPKSPKTTTFTEELRNSKGYDKKLIGIFNP
ncbi:MAG: hypothetical protein Tsb0033_28790 [Winogradskyella sp.]